VKEIGSDSSDGMITIATSTMSASNSVLKTCTMSKHGYSVKYPSTWEVAEVVSGGYGFSTCETTNSVSNITGKLTVISQDKKKEFTVVVGTPSLRKGTEYENCSSLESCTRLNQNLVASLPNRVSQIDSERILWSKNDPRWFYSYRSGNLYSFYVANLTDGEVNSLISDFEFTK
jgi:hypothetical protein